MTRSQLPNHRILPSTTFPLQYLGRHEEPLHPGPVSLFRIDSFRTTSCIPERHVVVNGIDFSSFRVLNIMAVIKYDTMTAYVEEGY